MGCRIQLREVQKKSTARDCKPIKRDVCRVIWGWRVLGAVAPLRLCVAHFSTPDRLDAAIRYPLVRGDGFLNARCDSSLLVEALLNIFHRAHRAAAARALMGFTAAAITLPSPPLLTAVFIITLTTRRDRLDSTLHSFCTPSHLLRSRDPNFRPDQRHHRADSTQVFSFVFISWAY
ncbi:hypothetical protein B0H16DRAFT_1711555 [Mycena metata]|uniref:Uncharacterized protein n=1 Tax=Mycena metata TaxID=1033252 RepID=A0AAD7NXH4_9AGAR|nr:hypothetical protein B0H16DRAFT_1711555 [Mycena metata]